jgi:hypothetical protein
MPPEAARALAVLAAGQESLARPAQAGRVIAMPPQRAQAAC